MLEKLKAVDRKATVEPIEKKLEKFELLCDWIKCMCDSKNKVSINKIFKKIVLFFAF